MRDIARLPDGILVILSAFYKACEHMRTWPEAIRMCLMALLPKFLGGCRTVANTPTIYRLLCGARKPIVKHGSLQMLLTGIPVFRDLRHLLRPCHALARLEVQCCRASMLPPACGA